MRLTDRVRPFIPAIRLPVRRWSPRSQVSHANPPPRDPLVPARSPPAIDNHSLRPPPDSERLCADAKKCRFIG